MATESEAVIELARARLANDLGCAPADLTLVEHEAVDWNDSSLGCPKRGMMYMQVITPGYRIVLAHNGQQYALHTDRRQRVVRCDGASHTGRRSRRS